MNINEINNSPIEAIPMEATPIKATPMEAKDTTVEKKNNKIAGSK